MLAMGQIIRYTARTGKNLTKLAARDRHTWINVITVCTVVHNCYKGCSKKYTKRHFSGATAEKPLNQFTQNVAWVITSGTSLSTPNGISISSGGHTHEGVKC